MKESIKKFFSREPVKRAIRTFLQAAAGYIAVNVAAFDFTMKNAVVGFVAASIAAGLAAVMNLEGGGGNDNAGN